ncbi:N-alpha-acetyltransferase 35, NatC auxiliary subunit-like isoform X2 [Amphibalanus amphitrite]|uniref:N-alpha-acetyltransferase 35, NatC auxiliary subunit-like isoform X2 n=1 Tax=Amphibalanus amphitrite TaxID=1232801 RepID=UPI001C908470|nr:N-alpha-acetyltransferase 35, NatC auxiliary subunit-like isoform X2 [Amphibalanus amphitrite]
MDLAPSAPPEPTEVEYHWTDITDDFLNACKDLKLGELVHDDMFGLFDAMSAIEMMDPKMDVGMLCNSSQRQIRSFQQAVEDGLLKTADLTPREQLGVMDTSLAYLLSWLEGHSLTQTVSTNAYLQAPHSIQDRCVKAFSVATIQLVNTISELLVQVALLYEEEDFQPQSLPDRTGVTPLRAVGMLREAEEDVTRELRARRKAGDTAAREETEELVAVQARLKFFRCLFQAVLAFSKKENQGLEEAWKALSSAKELLPVLKNTCPMGASYEQVEQAAKGGHLVTMGFDPLLNQRQLPPAFPRYPRLRALPATMDELTALLDRLLRLRTVLECKHLHALMMANPAASSSRPKTRRHVASKLSDFVGGGKEFDPSELPTLRAVIQKGILVKQKLMIEEETAKQKIERGDILKTVVPLILGQWHKANAKFCPPVIIKEKSLAVRIERLWKRVEDVAWGRVKNKKEKEAVEKLLDELLDITTCHHRVMLCQDPESGCVDQDKCKFKAHVRCCCPLESKIPKMELRWLYSQRHKRQEKSDVAIGGDDRPKSRRQRSAAKRKAPSQTGGRRGLRARGQRRLHPCQGPSQGGDVRLR